MRALISLIAGSLLLNLSAHAGSNFHRKQKPTTTDGSKALDEEEIDMDQETQSRGFEKQPQDYEDQQLNN